MRYLGRSGSRERLRRADAPRGRARGARRPRRPIASPRPTGSPDDGDPASAGAPAHRGRRRRRGRGDHADPARGVPAPARVDRHRAPCSCSARSSCSSCRAARARPARPSAPTTRRRPGRRRSSRCSAQHGVDVHEARSADGRDRRRPTAGATVFLYDEFGAPRRRPPRRARRGRRSPRRGRARFRRPRGAGPRRARSRARRAARSTTSPATAGPAERAGGALRRPAAAHGRRRGRRSRVAGLLPRRRVRLRRRHGSRPVGRRASRSSPRRRVFENEHVDEAGNAALAIGLLGASDELVWYLPGPADADAAEAPTLAELTPGWVSPVMVLAIVVAIAAGVWRGRRFGPLVVERPARARARRRDERGPGPALRAQRGARARTRPAPHRRDRPHRRRRCGCRARRRSTRSRMPRRTRPGATRHPWHGSSSAPARPATASSSTSPPSSTGSSTTCAASVRPRPDDRTDPTGRRP